MAKKSQGNTGAWLHKTPTEQAASEAGFVFWEELPVPHVSGLESKLRVDLFECIPKRIQRACTTCGHQT
eukprot:12888444-Prorocentrum_lima.AAC.1